jgi:hypothetical protein
MSIRAPIFLILALLVLPQAQAKSKKKQILPDYVLKAERVFVVIYPDAGEPLTQPTANRQAREEVENALMKWGRFQVVIQPLTADLVIAVRRGHASGPVISNSPSDNPPVGSTGIDGESRVGVQVGRPPVLTDSGRRDSDRADSHISNEAGPAEDTFGVYRGGTDYPLDAPPIWRYTGKDALKPPQVKAVEEFRKVFEESEKQAQHKP